MPITTISKLKDYVGQTVQLRGWVYNKRSSGKVKFLIFRDGTGPGAGVLQVILVAGVAPEAAMQTFEKLTQESSITVTGKVREEKRAKGGFELDGESIEILQIANDYPLGPKEHGPDFLLSNRHLWLRSSRPHAILKIRARFIKAVRDFFDNDGFVLVDSPIFTLAFSFTGGRGSPTP